MTKQRRRIILGILVLGALSLGAYFFYMPRTHVITETSRGFEPKSLLIHKGDTVTFVSKTGEQFWPASNSHPTHLLYAEFDPKRPLQPNESWSFTFTQAGVWPFHDHLNSRFTGTILVEGAPGESVTNCLKTPVAGIQAACYATQVASAIEEKGINEAFVEFRKFYEQDQIFRENCHDVMHVFGSRAYDLFEKNEQPIIQPETSFCAFGFYHGFIEEMFARNGPEQLQEGKAYCDLVGNSTNFASPGAATNARAACYHGMGHASFDTLPGTLWGNDEEMVTHALAQCKKISSTDTEYAQCGSGVFNSLANAYSGKVYNLAFNDVAPLQICEIQEPLQQVGCYKEIVLGQIRHQKMDYPTSLSFIHSIKNESIAGESLFGYLDDYIRYNRGNLSVTELPALCLKEPTLAFQKYCVKGVVVALLGGGEPGQEQKKPLEFCSLLSTGPLRSYCIDFSFDLLDTMFPEETVNGFCSALSPTDRESCLP